MTITVHDRTSVCTCGGTASARPFVPSSLVGMPLKPGDKAPDFTLIDQ
jgi:hypothetical protein